MITAGSLLDELRTQYAFPSRAIDESVLEDLVRLMLGRDTAFLRRAPLAGVRR